MLKSKQTSSRSNQHICTVHHYICFLSTTLAVSVNRSITQSDEKSKCNDVLYYELIIPTTLVCATCFSSTPRLNTDYTHAQEQNITSYSIQ